MTAADVEVLIRAHVPADGKEAADRELMLDVLERTAEPLSAAQPEAHFTASALVLDNSRARTCLILHRKLGLWLQPGGHIEPDDASIAGAALREVREETGLDAQLRDEAPGDEAPRDETPVQLDVHEIPDRPDMPAHLHLDVRFVVVAARDELTQSDESTDVRWWTIAEASRAGDESLARLIHAAIGRSRVRR